MPGEDSFSILVYDEKPLHLEFVAALLEYEGYRVETARDLATAKQKTASGKPDLALLSIASAGAENALKAFILNDIRGVEMLFLAKEDRVREQRTRTGQLEDKLICWPVRAEEMCPRVRKVFGLPEPAEEADAVDEPVSEYEKSESALREALDEIERKYREQRERLGSLEEAHWQDQTEPHTLPDARFGVSYEPFGETGGDFYEVIPVKDGFAYMVADFAGHHTGAVLHTAKLKALIRFMFQAGAEDEVDMGRPPDAIEKFEVINRLMKEFLQDDQYLSMCYAELDRKRGQFSFIGMGHPPPCYVPGENAPRPMGAGGKAAPEGESGLPKAGGVVADSMGNPRLIPLEGGLLGNFPRLYLDKPVTLSVSPGDRLYLYSDGLIESGDRAWNNEAGQEKLLGACNAVRSEPIDKAPGCLKAIMRGDDPKEDDILVLGIQV